MLGVTIVTHCVLFAKFSRDAAVDTRRGFEVLPSANQHLVPAATELPT